MKSLFVLIEIIIINIFFNFKCYWNSGIFRKFIKSKIASLPNFYLSFYFQKSYVSFIEKNLKLDLKINTTSSKIVKKSKSQEIKNMIITMKERVASWTINNVKLKKTGSEAEYLFINPNGIGSSKRWAKDCRINDFLNDFGIFQLNIDVAMNDYKF